MVDQNSQFYAILTNVGAAKQANADALGIAWKIAQMGVGDANDTEPTPNASQISLINEWRRAPLNQLKIDEKDSSIIVAEQVIPAEVGGRWIREIGLYDADGDLVAVANCPPTYKPLLNQGSGRTQVVRMNLVVSSSGNVELKIDPSVVLATREWVTGELAKQDFKHSVLVATTANIVLAGLQTIDEVVLAAGDRVLVKNQAAGKDNGLYTVAAGTWVRCSDADASAEVTPGLLVLVERGTVNGDSAWQLLTNAPITLGVTALAFDMAFGRTGVAEGTYRSVTVDKYGRVVAATNPTTVAGYGLTDVYTKTQIDQALALKAALASPDFSGTPLVPTAAAGTNTRQAASTAFVLTEIARLVASSPAALDTLNELAAALGNDPNFATTMTNALSLKAPLLSPVFTGDPRVPTPAVTDNDTSAANTAFVRNLLARYGLATNTAYVWAGNIDQITETGVYAVSNGATGTRPKTPGTAVDIVAGEILHLERDATNCAVQIWESLTGGVDAPAGGKSGLTFKRSRVSGGEWTAWGQVWDSVNTPKQSSLSDTLAGAMLTVGSFGLGASAINFSGNIDAIAASGLYMISAGTLGAKPTLPSGAVIAAGSILHIERGSSSVATQIWDSLVGDAITYTFIRTKASGGAWSHWKEMITGDSLPFRGIQTYKVAGVSAWAVPAGVKKALVTVIGAGGGGGFSAAASGLGSAGGGGGGLSQRLVDLTGVTSVSVTVGAGGAGAPVAGNTGSTGGTSSFGAYLSATGGLGGGGNNSNGNAPGSGGRGSGGDHNTSLGVGSPNYGVFGGAGGGPGPRSTQSGVAGNNAIDAGGGGSGAYVGNAGGNGADGCVIIQW